MTWQVRDWSESWQPHFTDDFTAVDGGRIFEFLARRDPSCHPHQSHELQPFRNGRENFLGFFRVRDCQRYRVSRIFGPVRAGVGL